MSPIQYYIIFAGAWAVINGILHDIFVLIQKRPYEKALIRLLIDGHILIFSGIIYWLTIPGLNDGSNMSFYIAITVSLFLLGYCALIFKMLPSIGTILVNAGAFIWLLFEFL